MPRILIPSDNKDFVVYWADAYRRAGHEVVVGAFNFDLCAANYDIVHYLWPEELTQWLPPDDAQLRHIEQCLTHWSRHARTILSVNNLYPHGHENNPAFHALYELFYRHAHAITHFTEASRRLVCEAFPAARQHPHHVVTSPFNYDRLLPNGDKVRDRAAARQSFGFDEDEFVVMVFGALRKWDEIELVRAAYDNLDLKGTGRRKRLLMAGRYNQRGPVWRQRIRRWSWSRWLKRVNALAVFDYIPDADVHRYFDAADVVFVPRVGDLSSGIPGLAMTFGTPVVAPEHGAFPDYLRGTDNPLYKSGDAASLARALEKVATLDRAAIAKQNRAVAETWSWDSIARACLDAVAAGGAVIGTIKAGEAAGDRP